MTVSSKPQGQWSEVFQLHNVPVHASLLPNGKILHWGRREHPEWDPQSPDENVACMDEHFTKSFLWTPLPKRGPDGNYGETEEIEKGCEPTYYNEHQEEDEAVNLFCSGHTFLSNGNLLVCGGHRSDGFGVEQASIFDYQAKRWVRQPLMYKGRWYPSVLALPDGRVLCISGSDNTAMDPTINSIPQILSIGSTPSQSTWNEVADPIKKGIMLDLFPRIHIDPKTGNPIMIGTQDNTWMLEIKDADGNDIKDSDGVIGRWTSANTKRSAGYADYASSVMYASGKIMYVGGGRTHGDWSSLRTTEFLDLNEKDAKWDAKTVDMLAARKQLNATILADGQVLVTGGTSGGGFNDWNSPVLMSEMMDPNVEPKKWIEMAGEKISRCYHSVALLLPDGRVFSAGGGEYNGCTTAECHADAQLFEPPYLHLPGPRPTISSAPSEIEYGKEFQVSVSDIDSKERAKITLIRLGSVTHCRNMSQQLIHLDHEFKDTTTISIKSPANPNIAPPGPYMLFVLNQTGKPSIAHMVSVLPTHTPVGIATRVANVAQQMIGGVHASFSSTELDEPVTAGPVQLHLADHDKIIADQQDGPHVVVGLTPICPYGLGPCWGGAYAGLQAITDIDTVRPVPSNIDCVAFVYLKQDILPDIDVWRTEFQNVASKAYTMRGIEVTISGTISKGGSDEDELILSGTSIRPDVTLASFGASSQLKWNIKEGAPKPVNEVEAGAYKTLVAALADHSGAEVKVTGTLQKHEAGRYYIEVREFVLL